MWLSALGSSLPMNRSGYLSWFRSIQSGCLPRPQTSSIPQVCASSCHTPGGPWIHSSFHFFAVPCCAPFAHTMSMSPSRFGSPKMQPWRSGRPWIVSTRRNTGSNPIERPWYGWFMNSSAGRDPWCPIKTSSHPSPFTSATAIV